MNMFEGLEDLIDDYVDDVLKSTDEILADEAKQLAKTIKADSPRSSKAHKHYADGWKSTKDGGEYVVYNSTKPSLSHLLEHGHLMPDGSRAKAYPHINANADEAIEDTYKKIKVLIG